MLSTVATVLLAAALMLVGATQALAASEYAATNEAFVQGDQKDGDPVATDRSDASEALGAPDGEFVSLGFGGEIWLGFSQNMKGNLSLAVQEVTSGPYPLETADVYVGTDTNNWTFVGSVSNEEGTGDGLSTIEGIEQCFQFVRIVDTTDSDLHGNNADGFDVDAVEANYDRECPKPKKTYRHIRVSNENVAIVKNISNTDANTGGNYAGGSTGGNGGHGGGVENDGGDQDVEGADTGNGGKGGDAGLGGTIVSGDANANSSVDNVVNSNDTRINTCDCEGKNRIRVRNSNFAMVFNHSDTDARTGDNAAAGSEAGNGGNGGDIENGNDHFQVRSLDNGYGYGGEQEVDDVTTGNGGNGGVSSDGGQVLTGRATARDTITNLVNTNFTRIR